MRMGTGSIKKLFFASIFFYCNLHGALFIKKWRVRICFLWRSLVSFVGGFYFDNFFLVEGFLRGLFVLALFTLVRGSGF